MTTRQFLKSKEINIEDLHTYFRTAKRISVAKGSIRDRCLNCDSKESLEKLKAQPGYDAEICHICNCIAMSELSDGKYGNSMDMTTIFE